MKTILTLFTSIFCFSIPGIAASDDQHWDDQFAPPGADNLVLAMTPTGSNLYAGGFFTVMGEVKSPAIMKWDGTNWAGLGTGLKGDSPLVYAIAVRGADVYVGGFSITNAGGISVTNLARWNGTSWSDIGGVNGFIKSMLVVSNDLYVAGDFTRAGGVTATNIARWDGANWWPLGNGLSGYTNGPYAYVSSMALDANGHVVAAGLFRFADGLEVNNIARWDGSQWHAFNGGAGGGPYPFISDVKAQGTNLYIAGAFQSAGGVNATNLARWDGTQWYAMGGGPSGTNYALAFFNGQIYTAGQFTNISGTRILNVASWDGAAWQPLAAGLAGEISTQVSSLSAAGDYLYAGGDFVRAGAAGVLGIARWNGVEWSALNGMRTKGLFLTSRTVSIVGSQIYAGGAFQVIGGVWGSRIGRFDGAKWDAMGGGVTGPSPSISTIVANGGSIYAGGTFTNAGGVAAKNVARWDGVNWYPMASGLNSNVSALIFHNGELFAGGTFTRKGDSSGSFFGVAKWNGSDWVTIPGIDAGRINNSISAFASDGTYLYAGGNFFFSSIATGQATNIARWNGANWFALGVGLNITVSSLAVQGGFLYAGGSFTNSGAQELDRIAKWDGSSWSSVGAGFGSGSVNALAANGSYLYAAGSFTNSGATLFNRIARWNGTSWSGLGSGVTRTPGSASVTGIALSGDDVYIAGNFTEAGGKPAYAFGRWNDGLTFGPPPRIFLLSPRFIPSGEFTFQIGGLTSGPYSVESSTNLANWDVIYTGNATNANFTNGTPGLPRRFYRARTP